MKQNVTNELKLSTLSLFFFPLSLSISLLWSRFSSVLWSSNLKDNVCLWSLHPIDICGAYLSPIMSVFPFFPFSLSATYKKMGNLMLYECLKSCVDLSWSDIYSEFCPCFSSVSSPSYFVILPLHFFSLFPFSSNRVMWAERKAILAYSNTGWKCRRIEVYLMKFRG